MVEPRSGNVLSLCPNSLGTIRWLCRSGLSSVNISKLWRRSVNNRPLQIDNHYWLSQQQESYISFYTKSGTTVCLCVWVCQCENISMFVLYLMWPSWNDHLFTFFSCLFISYSFFAVISALSSTAPFYHITNISEVRKSQVRLLQDAPNHQWDDFSSFKMQQIPYPSI